MYKRILISTDGSDISQKAAQSAVALASSMGAEVYAISVKEPFPYSAISEMQPVPPQEFFDAQERVAAARVQAATDEAAGLTAHGHTVEALHPWEAILDHAKTQNCDLIVMASHGRRALGRLLLGSQTSEVLARCGVPVLVIR